MMLPKRKFSATRLVIAIFGICLTYFILRTEYLTSKAFSTVENKSQGRHLTFPDNSVHNGYQINISKLLNGKFQIRNSKKHVEFANPNNSLLKSNENQSNDIQITYRNSSIQTNYQKKETQTEHGKSSTKSIDIVASTPIYPLFQPAEEEEFPTTDGRLPRIPHIIHQIYADEMIPEMYINHVHSFIKNNPTWEYRFWTDESGRRLLEKHHPYLVDVYDNFGRTIMRSDLLRYAVLYEYGGFYADLDMDNLRSLNITTVKYACIVPVEPFEHSVLLYEWDYLMNNAIMSCRPKHPFFKLLLWNLRGASPMGDIMVSTGPKYVTEQFIRYYYIDWVQGYRNKTKTDLTSNSPYFYKGEPVEDDNNSVYVPNTQYFTDKVDPIYVTDDGKLEFCKGVEDLPYMSQRACSEFYKRKHIRENKKYTFTEHHWYHLWIRNTTTVNELKKVNIRDVVPTCILYN